MNDPRFEVSLIKSTLNYWNNLIKVEYDVLHYSSDTIVATEDTSHSGNVSFVIKIYL